MSLPPEAEQRVSRLENDASAIYAMVGDIQRTQRRHGVALELLSAIQAEHTDTLAEHTDTLAEHTRTLADHTDTLAEHGTKLDRIIDLLEQRT